MTSHGKDRQAIFVEAPARLHFGVLDPCGVGGRWFGGLGAAAPAPTLLVSASPADALDVHGVRGVGAADVERSASFARAFLQHHHLDAGACVCVHRALPAHAGLGSGTQLGLAVARALAEVHGLAADAPSLARAVGRGRRSAVGTWTFARGGFVVEGGRRVEDAGSADVAPLLAGLPFPPAWRCVVAVPDAAAGVSGDIEAEALARLPPPAGPDVERVAALVMDALLPAIAARDLQAFGEALTEVQTINGRWFAPVQGGTYASGPSAELVRSMTEWGAPGVGQSSWGPTVYAIVEGEDAARRLADRARAVLGGAGDVYEGPFGVDGARIWRAPVGVRFESGRSRLQPTDGSA